MQDREIIHDGEPLRYALRRSMRARRASLRVELDGRIVLTLPERTAEWVGTRFLRARAAWARATSAAMSARNKDRVLLPTARRDYLRHRETARMLVHGCIARINIHYGFRHGVVRIKDMRANWGSCSSRGNLNFNYKIALLPAHLADYLVAHELCHLAEFNHSPRFWALVARACPDHKERRKELRGYVL